MNFEVFVLEADARARLMEALSHRGTVFQEVDPACAAPVNSLSTQHQGYCLRLGFSESVQVPGAWEVRFAIDGWNPFGKRTLREQFLDALRSVGGIPLEDTFAD
jgi:hypothetical protein